MRDYYVPGQWNTICDRCGFEFKSAKLKKEWTGLMVCGACWEPRHPQTLIQVRGDNPSVPWNRPEPTDVFIDGLEFIMTEAGDPIMPESQLLPLQTET